MCSLAAMPADYEMLMSHSPPVFSHSPPLGSGFTDYSNSYCRNNANWRRPNSLSLAPPSAPRRQDPLTPPRPCLVVRPEEVTSDNSNSGDLLSPTRLKKKVVFADDKGLALTQVRVMTEPSNAPPAWSSQFLEQVTKGLSAEVAPEPWEVMFPQPASDYLDFRNRLDTENVSLENVIVRESDQVVVGTVKVRNLAFHKEVLVRSSSDSWATHEDAHCTYVPTITGASAAYSLYDKFSFRLTLPPRSRRIEFCVCYRVEGVEYWDNNGGKNYVLLKKSNSCNTSLDGTAPNGSSQDSQSGCSTTEFLKQVVGFEQLIHHIARRERKITLKC
ncbi:protein phosphatase 1 regulatory subunit 3B isoform X2 [Anabrus simplex]|uniref:protein phosphatase 1 regulatory subunit 3B isoform X2 n=1 Tax=Anabrus simplex TaxID=316456 RepID=UPI0035A29F5D